MSHPNAPYNKMKTEDPDYIHSKTYKLEGFVKWADWVPHPHPHREIMSARKNYVRGDTIMVQTPDFVDFPNKVAHIESRN